MPNQLAKDTDEATHPFLKWPGGKRWATDHLKSLIPSGGKYFEPFLGGGAVFFSLRPPQAVLSDINSDLINAYVVVRDSPDALIDEVQSYEVCEANYYRIRESEPAQPLQRAARFLYLNRTAFGGIYRENRQGRFNVPFGYDRKPDALWRDGLVAKASRALQGVEIHACDFAVMMECAGEGDVVYCDPTYTVAHNNNGFRRYNERNFSWCDQQRLAERAERARQRGAVVLVSNAHHDAVRALYPGAETVTLTRRSSVARRPEERRDVSEYLFVLRPD